MGNRGSKSELKYKSVKEQRVDGSYFWVGNDSTVKMYSNGRRKSLSNQNPI